MSHEFAYRNELKRISLVYVYGRQNNEPPTVIARETNGLINAGINIDKLVSILPRGWTHDRFCFKNIPNSPNLPDCERFFPPKNRKKLF